MGMGQGATIQKDSYGHDLAPILDFNTIYEVQKIFFYNYDVLNVN